MPFTPFHFGPGMLIKGLIPKQFSLSVFALANIAMDVEPLYHLLRGGTQLHGASHTLIGAACIGAGTALIAPTAITRAWQWYQKFHVVADLVLSSGLVIEWIENYRRQNALYIASGNDHSENNICGIFKDRNSSIATRNIRKCP